MSEGQDTGVPDVDLNADHDDGVDEHCCDQSFCRAIADDCLINQSSANQDHKQHNRTDDREHDVAFRIRKHQTRST